MIAKKKLSELPKFKNYKDGIVLLLKFSPYIDSLIGGNLYMNNLKYYINREIETGDRGLGDKLEASLSMSGLNFGVEKTEQVPSEGTDANYTIRFKGNTDLDTKLETSLYVSATKGLPLEGSGATLRFSFDSDEKRPVFCLFSVTIDNLTIVDENEKFYIAELDYTSEEKEKMIREFGDELLAIEHVGHFCERVEKAFLEKGYDLIHREVRYDDFSINTIERLESWLEPENNDFFFWKDKYFENQNEYRFVISNVETNEPIIVNIGDISDISRKCNAREFFFSNVPKFRFEK
ncbi:hypothetical protein [Priestia aryabhattai]|uniref:hypothetical protein n=1 Tax=Priestia aryabhattai TaxID=412384 RepID=UPI0008DCE0E4|nr:hypothetical protein [Priestia aryabhattai]OHY76649.1 hypothetical protein BCV52_18355 [Priestia aryabhattai]OVE34664.1 hypothetical protein CCZ20_25630 [Priestia aryabhattai]